MSTASVILSRLDALTAEVRRLYAVIAARAPALCPERLTTAEAVIYVRQAYGRPSFHRMTLYRWLDEGRLHTDIQHPRRWLRSEIDAALGGVPMNDERRGKRREIR